MSKENQLVSINQELATSIHSLKPSIDVIGGYWSPTEEGESKRGVLTEFKNAEYKDKNLLCVFFVEINEDGSLTTYRNGSTQLVAAAQESVADGRITPFKTPVEIKYKGTKKTGSGNTMALWGLSPLV